jgi:hypothetical protein
MGSESLNGIIGAEVWRKAGSFKDFDPLKQASWVSSLDRGPKLQGR